MGPRTAALLSAALAMAAPFASAAPRPDSLPPLRFRPLPLDSAARPAVPRRLPDSVAARVLADPATVPLFTEDFEAATIPGARWDAFDLDPASGADTWGVVDWWDGHVAYDGVKSAYCAAVTDRTDGRYDHDMEAYLVLRSPIDTGGGVVVVTFQFWLEAVYGEDHLFLETSCDGVNWDAIVVALAPQAGWRQAQWAFTGCGPLWLRFVFRSDAANNARGVYLDAIRVEGSTTSGPDLAWARPPGWPAPIVFSRTPGTHLDQPPLAGSPTYVDLALVNQGQLPTQACIAWLSFGGASAFDAVVPPLAGGQTALLEDLEWVFASAGPVLAEAQADVYGVSGDADPDNNFYQRYVQVTMPPAADLVVRSLTVGPAWAVSGEVVTAMVAVENAGAIYSQLFWLGLYWTLSSAPPPGTPADSLVLVAGLLPGESRTYAFTRAHTGDADLTVFARADVYGAETEPNEADNLAGPAPCHWRALHLVARDLGTGGDVGLRWTGLPGLTYRVERSPTDATSYDPIATTADTVWRDAARPENDPRRYRIVALRSGSPRGATNDAIAAARLPLVLVHGLVVSPLLFPRAAADTLKQWAEWRYLLEDPAAPADRFEHVWSPAMNIQDDVGVNEAYLEAYLDTRLSGLARRNQQEFGFVAPPRQVQAIGYSAGGLCLRLLMHRRHGLVRRAVLLGTPSGGTPIAGFAALSLARLPEPPLIGSVCDQRPLICQCIPVVTELLFNPFVHRDPTAGTVYAGLAGTREGPWSMVIPGPDDGTVSVESVFHPAVFPWNHPRRTADVNHDALRRSLPVLANDVYVLLTGRPRGGGIASLPGDPAPEGPVAVVAAAGPIALPASPPRGRRAPRASLGSTATPGWHLTAGIRDSLPAGGSRTYALPLPGGAAKRFFLLALDGGDFGLTLRDPSGLKWDSLCASVDETCTYRTVPADGMFPGAFMRLDAPVGGTWQVTVAARTPQAPAGAFTLAVEESLDIWLRAEPELVAVAPGQTAWLRARLDSAGRTVPGAQVRCEGTAPGGTRLDVTLADDGLHQDGAAGDGLFGGAVPAGAAPGAAYLAYAAALSGGRTRRAVGILQVGLRDQVPPRVEILAPTGPGAVLMGGAGNEIVWTSSDSAGVDSVAIGFSLEDGSLHIPIGAGLPAEGRVTWVAPDSLFGRMGRLRIVAFDRSGNWSEVWSDPLMIVVVVDTDGARIGDFELRLAGGNPTCLPVLLEVRLPLPQRARLEVLDVQGRRVRTLLDAALAPGLHRARWPLDDDAGTAVASGLYWIRLRGPHRSATRSLVVLR